MSLEDTERVSRIAVAGPTTTTTTGTTTTNTTTASTIITTTTTPPPPPSTRDGETGPASYITNSTTTTSTSIGEPDESNTSTLFHNQIRFHHLAAATGLIVTYFIEIIVQIFLIVHCCRPFILFTSASWDWSGFLAISFVASSLAVTIVSIVWVCRGLDFAGRLCGRLLCYVMHSLLLGLLWRFLKLAFVYDRADVQEFVALRIFQAYFQSLPLASIHLAWLISSRENWSSVALGTVLVEFLSVVTALVLSSYIKSDDQRSKSKGEVMQIIVKNLNCSSVSCQKDQTEKKKKKMQETTTMMTMTTTTRGTTATMMTKKNKNQLWPQFLETKLAILSRALLLCSRLFVIGIIIVHLRYWTCMFILVHFMVSFTWISFSVNNGLSSSSRSSLLEDVEEGSSSPLTKSKDLVTLVTECCYTLFWDVTATPNAISIWTWLLPVVLVLLENGTIILLHWHKQEDRVVTIISGSCLLLGWLLFSSLNFIKSYSAVSKCYNNPSHPHHHHQQQQQQHPTHKETKTGITKDMSQQQTLPVVDPMMITKTSAHPPGDGSTLAIEPCFEEKTFKMIQSDSLKWNTKKIPASWDLNLFSTTPSALPNNYNQINEKLMTRVKADVSSTKVGRNKRKFKTESPEAVGYRASPPEGPRSNSINPSQCPLVAPTTWVPDTCCNDSNGSSNSRNTNTIRDTGTHHPDLDNDTDVDNPNFVFYFPTDTSGQQSVTSARFQKCIDRSSRNNTPPTSQGQDHYHLYHHQQQQQQQQQQYQHHHHHHHQHPEADLCRKRSGNNHNSSSSGKKKKTRSSSSISSFRNGVCRYRTSTPIEIKRASRIAVTTPHAMKESLGGGGGTPTTTTTLHCYCHGDKSGQGEYYGDNGKEQQVAQEYEKLIEDSYGILICEGESSAPGICAPVYRNEMSLQQQASAAATVQASLFHHGSSNNKKLKVLCAKCLQNHDPLLTNCLETDARTMSKQERSQVLLALGPPSSAAEYMKGRLILKSSALPHSRTPPVPHISNNSIDDDDDDDDDEEEEDVDHDDGVEEDEDGEPLPSDTTDYPSETEMTCTLEGDEQLSVSSNLSTATYTTWPHQSQPNLSMWTTSTMMPQSRFPKEFTSLEYVRTWLLTSQARLRHHHQQQQQHHHRQETRNRLAKKVYRSNTMAAQSRKVRFVGAVTKDAYIRSVGRSHSNNNNHSSSSNNANNNNSSSSKGLSKRHHHGPSLQLHLRTSSASRHSPSTSLSFQPPPRQKQHPVLPHINVIPHHKGIRAHTNCHSSSNGIPIQHSDSFYKDVEIIL